MATPPRSSKQTGRSLSPSKKRRMDEDGDQDNGNSISRSDNDRAVGQDVDATPQSDPRLSRPSLAMRPASFQPPSSTSLGHSSDRQSSRRSTSPVKTITGLQRLGKPVLYRSLDGDAGFQQLPEDVRPLYDSILDVTMSRTGTYPAEIRAQIESLLPRHPPADSFYRKPEEEPDHNRRGMAEERGKEEGPFFDYLPLTSLFADRLEGTSLPARFALAEFYKIRAISAVARECLDLRRSEAAWNVDVHGPLLKLALSRRYGSVMCENATSARILPCFRPSLVTGEVSEGKMVDFVLAPRLSPELDAAIQNKLVEFSMQSRSPALASAQLCLNQTDYTPLTRSPSAISIETKVAGASLEEGRLQLGIWTAAWHKRMEFLGVGGGIRGPQLPTLPLILVHDHQWSLYFAVDRLDKIEICGALLIGMTDNLPNIYPLLTVLGLLGTWIDTTFRSWATDTFGPQT